MPSRKDLDNVIFQSSLLVARRLVHLFKSPVIPNLFSRSIPHSRSNRLAQTMQKQLDMTASLELM